MIRRVLRGPSALTGRRKSAVAAVAAAVVLVVSVTAVAVLQHQRPAEARHEAFSDSLARPTIQQITDQLATAGITVNSASGASAARRHRAWTAVSNRYDYIVNGASVLGAYDVQLDISPGSAWVRGSWLPGSDNDQVLLVLAAPAMTDADQRILTVAVADLADSNADYIDAFASQGSFTSSTYPANETE